MVSDNQPMVEQLGMLLLDAPYVIRHTGVFDNYDDDDNDDNDDDYDDWTAWNAVVRRATPMS